MSVSEVVVLRCYPPWHSTRPVGWAGISRNHSYRTHSNHQPWVEAEHGKPHTRERKGRHL